MRNAAQRLDNILNDIEINCDPTIGSRECTQFSLDCLALIRHRLPPIASEAAKIVRRYLENQLSLEDVIDTSLKCWQYLDEHYKNVPITDPSVSSIRAVIFPLDAQKTQERRNIVDHLSSFLELVNNVEPHHMQEEELLRVHFAKCV